MSNLIHLAFVFLYCYPVFENPFYIDFGTHYFSPFNYVSKGGAIDLVDTSLILFLGNEKLYGGFSYNRISRNYDFAAKNPVTLYIGRSVKSEQFFGFSLSGFNSFTKNFSCADLISETAESAVIPSLYYSRRLDYGTVVFLRADFPVYRNSLITPTDTFVSNTKFSSDLSFACFKRTTFQWQYFLIFSYFIRSYSEKYSTIQNLLNYDSTRSYSRLDASLYVIYTPFQNSFLALGPAFVSGCDSYYLSTVFASQYEILSNFFLYFEYLYGYQWKVQRTGTIENKHCDSYVAGPILGLRYRKDFLFFVFDYSLSERRFWSVSVKFDFVR